MFFKKRNESRPHLKKLYRQVDQLGTSLHFAGFAILCKDMAEFLAAKGYSGPHIDLFRQAYNKVLNVDRYYWEAFCPEALANLCEVEDLPSGIAAKAAVDNFKLPPELCDRDLVNPWSRYLGWSFFREYSVLLAPFIHQALAIDVPDEQQSDRQETVELADLLIGGAVPEEKHWYPLFLYLSILLYHTEFETLPTKLEQFES